MNKSDTAAIKYILKRFGSEKTDKQIAVENNVPEEEVRQLRLKSNLSPIKGKESVKEFLRRYFLEMPEAEKREFVKTLDHEFLLKMAEGMPATTGTLEVHQEPIRIDITHQLAKVYGQPSATDLPANRESLRLSEGSGK